jgi:tRNA uridine 5-carboxymethylaminomethyl modification enzyme
MFTSRAEFRLTMRCDNADLRLTPIGMEVGCVGPERLARFEGFRSETSTAMTRAHADLHPPQALAGFGLAVKSDGQLRGVFDLLRPDGNSQSMDAAFPWLVDLSPRVRRQIEVEALYSGYLQRQNTEARQLRSSESARLPYEMDYDDIGGLSTEMRERLSAARPTSLGALSRIPGITPPAVMAVIGHVRRRQAQRFT